MFKALQEGLRSQEARRRKQELCKDASRRSAVSKAGRQQEGSRKAAGSGLGTQMPLAMMQAATKPTQGKGRRTPPLQSARPLLASFAMMHCKHATRCASQPTALPLSAAAPGAAAGRQRSEP
jgi:hypothetical protein